MSFGEHLATVVLHFDVGGETLGLDVTAVAEVTAATPVVRLPGVPAAVAGLTALRARPITVIDVAVLLALTPAADSDRTALLVLAEPWNHLALSVAANVGLSPLVRGRSAPASGHAQLGDGREVRLLDPEAIVVTLERSLGGPGAGLEAQPWT